jgi:hypothetical protein
MIKAIIHVTETRPDMYGNTYRRASIQNTRTGQTTPTFHATSEGNAVSMVSRLLNATGNELASSVSCTNSARLSSLPDGDFVRPAELAAELRKIGFRIPAERARTCPGCF